jgi:subtilase family serine protease
MTRNKVRSISLGGALCLATVVGVLVGGTSVASAGVRLSPPAVPRVALRDTLPQFRFSAPLLGVASPDSSAVALISLQHRDQGRLLRFIGQVSNPRSRSYQHYLSPKQFIARYAPGASTVAQVEAFARGYGLSVSSVPSNRAYVYVTGTVAEMDRAFRTSIDLFKLNGRTIQAPAKALSIPKALASVVTGVSGLNTGDVARPLGLLETPPSPAFVNAPPFSSYWGQSIATQAPGADGQSVLPNVVQGYTPQQIEGAYGVSRAIADGLDGAGQTVAVIDAYSSPTIVSDADEWSHVHGLPQPKLVLEDNAAERDQPEGPTIPTDVPEVGGLNLQDPQGWFGEETLDVEAVDAMAPEATIVVQSALSPENVNLEMAQNHVVSGGLAQIISNSYGGTSDATDKTSDGYWQEAAAQGIGVYFSSGDDGDQTAGGTDPSARSVDEDPNSPYVTAVGGTTLAIGKSNNYQFETYWGTDTATLTGDTWGPSTFQSGGGGGTSEVYAEPSYQAPVAPAKFADYWQNNANATSGATIPGRVVPDVAMLADPNSGFLMGQTQDYSAYSNPLGYDLPRDTDQFGQYRIGGTSLASPLFAGMMALADQAAGTPHGFANPALYRLSQTASFHDISAPQRTVAVVRTNYANNTNASGGTQTVLRTTGDTGTLSSVPGFDDSTGLGSPNGMSFLAGLAPGSPWIAKLEGRPKH